MWPDFLAFCKTALAEFAFDKTLGWAAKTCRPYITTVPGPLRWRAHFTELKTKIREMPFIYKDLEGDVLADFVETDLASVNLESLMGSAAPTSSRQVLSRLAERRKALVLGVAGIGKTTFLRHTILALADERGYLEHLFGKEYLIPFYVPLKNIDNTTHYPVLRYLLESNSVLRGSGGIGRITRKAKGRHVILLLDAYDESPFPSGDQGRRSFLLEELSLFFSPDTPAFSDILDPATREFYESIRSCRIWLSSRKEFFQQHPVPLAASIPIGMGPEVATMATAGIELRGIGRHRGLLVKRIFDKYKRLSSFYQDHLDEELFLTQLDSKGGPELRSLSTNPLFLTVMVYVYVNHVRDSGGHRFAWDLDLPCLILECIRLLLVDLDEAKSAGLPAATKDAVLRRRNRYVTEKIAFLKWFALTTFLEGKAAFDLTYLRGKAEEYWMREDPTGAGELLAGLRVEGESPSEPDFAQQLVFCGVFVMIDRQGARVTYDFPHRRFKEVLAIQELSRRADCRELLRIFASRPDLSEALYVLFAISQYQDEILNLLFARISEPGVPAVIATCVRRRPQRYDATPSLEAFFRKNIAADTHFVLPVAVFEGFVAKSGFLDYVGEEFRNAAADGRLNSLSLCLELTEQICGAAALESRVNSLLATALGDDRLRPILVRHACRLGWDPIRPHLPWLRANDRGLFDLCMTLNGHTAESVIRDVRFVSGLLNSLEREQQLRVIGALARNGSRWLKELDSAGLLTEEMQVVQAVAQTLIHQPERHLEKNAYALTGAIAGEFELTGPAASSARGWAFDQDAFLETLMPISNDEPLSVRRAIRENRQRLLTRCTVDPEFVERIKANLDWGIDRGPQPPRFFI